MSETLRFRKSSYSGSGNNCVEVADIPGASAVRDSQHPEQGHLWFSTEAWSDFLRDVVNDEL